MKTLALTVKRFNMIKGFKKKAKLADLAHRVKNVSTKNTHVLYKSSGTHCSKVISKVKFSKRRTNSKIKVTGKNVGTHGKVFSQEILI